MLLPVVKAVRPHQWVKNLFVAAPLVFAHRIDDPRAVLRMVVAVACFCMLSSSVYLLNDIVDIDKDRAHPTKRNRAIASGALSVPAARVLAGALATLALVVGVWLGPRFDLVAGCYLVLNLAYSFALKRIAFIDVGCISVGFLLRVLGGAFAIPVPPSGWLLACTLLLAALLGFGKRSHELRMAGNKGVAQRDVLERYNPRVLRILLVTLAALTTMTYGAYTQSPHALHFFGTRTLALTVPFVLFGIVRFLSILQRPEAESPTDTMLRDKPFMLNLLGYAVVIVLVIYRGH